MATDMAPIPATMRRPEPRRRRAPHRLAALAAALGVLLVAEGAAAQIVRVQPSVQTRLTYTDNIDAGAATAKRSDWIAELAPGVSVSRASGRFSGDLNAQLRGLAHVRETDRNAGFVVLGGNGRIEAVEDLFFVDLAASISRNNRSGLRGRAGDDFLNVDRANETRQFSVGPRLTLRPFGTAEGLILHRSTWFDGGGQIDGRRTADWQAGLSDPAGLGRFGWGVDARRSDTRFDDPLTPRTTQKSSRATLFYNVSPQLRLSGNVGSEWNDFSTGVERRTSIKGVGFDWRPNERTTIAGSIEDRFFGNGYSLRFDHRRPLSAWNLAWTRDVSSSLDTRTVPVVDLDFERIAAITDPAERERQLELLREVGPRFDFVSSRFFVARSLRGGVSLIGARNVLTLSLQRTERARLGDPVTNDPRDDFATFDETRDDSASIAFSHRLSAFTSLNSTLTHSRSRGTGLAATTDRTDRTLFALGITSRVGPRSTGGLQYRYQKSDGVTDFTENVLTANFGMRF